MKVLVTGGTGFIGSHLVEALHQRGDQVAYTTRGTAGTAFSHLNGVQCVSMEDLIREVFDLNGIDVLFHLAAIRHRWGVPASDYLTSNVDLTQILLERARGRVGHFIYCSSIAVFGWPPRGPIDESFAYDPINIYGISKVRCEKMILQWHRKGKIRATVIRPSIAYGRRDPSGMLSKLTQLINRGTYATVGTGENRVQLAHVSDIVQGFVKAASSSKSHGRSYIITARSPIRINRLVALVSRELGKPCPRWRIPRFAAMMAALGLETCYGLGLSVTGPEPLIAREKIQVMTTDRHYAISRAEKEIGYSPRYDYEDGVVDFIAGMREEGLIGPNRVN